MKQQDFENRYSKDWAQFEMLLEDRDSAAPLSKDIPELYRQTCSHLAMAKQRQYSQVLISRLNKLIIAGHHRLYQKDNKPRLDKLLEMLSVFPRVLKQNRYYVIAATVLFVLPGVVMGLACYFNDAMIYSLLPTEQVRQFEAMYEPSNDKFGRERGSDTDLLMFGYYIKNNIGIAFRTFAGGILFGLGSIFFLFYNGLYIGAIFGRLTQVGFGITLYPFVIGHGAFELTAIVFAGAAGLKIGFSLVSPGSLSRLQALTKAAREAVVILYGATFMLLIAAFLEAFWSSSSVLPVAVKFSVGGLFWLLVFWFCFFYEPKRNMGKPQES